MSKIISDRLISSKEPVTCKFCKFNNIECIISRSENLKKHILWKHQDFIKMRAKKCNISFDNSVI